MRYSTLERDPDSQRNYDGKLITSWRRFLEFLDRFSHLASEDLLKLFCQLTRNGEPADQVRYSTLERDPFEYLQNVLQEHNYSDAEIRRR